MLVAGFVDGRLIYIFEFSFNEPDFVGELERQLNRRFPNGDVAGLYLRSAYFTFRHYANAVSLKVNFVASRDELRQVRPHISRDVFNYLESRYARV